MLRNFPLIHDFVVDATADLDCISETLLNEKSVPLLEVCPSTFQVVHMLEKLEQWLSSGIFSIKIRDIVLQRRDYEVG